MSDDDLLEIPEPTREQIRAELDYEREQQRDNADRSRPEDKTVTHWLQNAPHWLREQFKSLSAWTDIPWGHDSHDWQPGMTTRRRLVNRLIDAEAIGSRRRRWVYRSPAGNRTDYIEQREEEERSTHILMLDIDHPAVLIPSTSEGNSHLIIGVTLEHEQWVKVITLLAEVGVIEEGYAGASLARGESFLRLPWIRKFFERADHAAAMDEWLNYEEPGPPESGEKQEPMIDWGPVL